MTIPRGKLGLFVLEGLNSFTATFYLFYLFFLTRDEFGFTNRGNLLLTAAHGFVYIFASWQGGRFAQRFGGYNALKLGFVGMALGLTLGLIVPGLKGQVLALICWTAPCCLIWPALEALVTEGETDRGTARMVGLYNLVWSGACALAYFSGGWLWDQLGRNGLYVIPIVVMVVQLVLTIVLARLAKKFPTHTQPAAPSVAQHPEPAAFRQKIPPQRFLQMAWLANPFAYVAINTVGAVIPQLAARFSLTPTQTGMFCSLWFFTRFAAFFILWRWTGWHYRFRWLLAAFVGLVFGFTLLLLAEQFWLVVVAQLIFGSAIGLIYYSSLFYSMDVGEAKGEHGGIHEAAIGLGICVGPGVGAAALHFVPDIPRAGTWAVAGLLTLGLGALVWMRARK